MHTTTPDRSRRPRGAAGLARVAGLAVVLVAALAAGCSESESTSFEEGFKRPSSQPFLLAPIAGSTGVSPLPEVRVVYEEALDAATVTAAAVALVDLGPGLDEEIPVPVSLSLTPDGRGIVLRPVSQLVAPRTFEVRVLGRASGMRFVDGNDVDDFSFQFTTAPDPQILTQMLPAAQGGAFYSQGIATTGGSGGLVLQVTRGTLPAGLTLLDDLIRGIPVNTTSSTLSFAFEVSAFDAIGRRAPQDFTIDVAP